MNTCRSCGGHDDVRHGHCKQCRALGEPVEAVDADMPEPPELEPPKDRPWVARSAFFGRIRRSPRS